MEKTEARARPTFESIYMKLAHVLARRSTCRRLQVGTVITSTDYRKVLAVGYNGNASGLHNDCDREEPGNCGCLHSEENAVINCDAPRHTEKIVFVTRSEEHTSELQSRQYLVCRLLLEKKKKNSNTPALPYYTKLYFHLTLI